MPVGIDDPDKIGDSQITASTHNDDCQPFHGRLNDERSTGWCAKEGQRTDDWLQVDLGYNHVLCGFATQGNANRNEYVTEFKLSHSKNESFWTWYKDKNGKEAVSLNICGKKKTVPITKYLFMPNRSVLFYFFTQIFHKKGDSETVDQHTLPMPLEARYVRFHPVRQVTWNCMRVEAYKSKSLSYLIDHY